MYPETKVKPRFIIYYLTLVCVFENPSRSDIFRDGLGRLCPPLLCVRHSNGILLGLWQFGIGISHSECFIILDNGKIKSFRNVWKVTLY